MAIITEIKYQIYYVLAVLCGDCVWFNEMRSITSVIEFNKCTSVTIIYADKVINVEWYHTIIYWWVL